MSNMDLNNLSKKDIETDIMKYKNNKLSFLLCILAIICDASMFIMLYSTNSCIPNVELGADLIINVIFLLACFLGAEKNKVYDRKWGIVSFVLAGIQIARIFWIPTKYFRLWLEDNTAGLPAGKYVAAIVLIILSAVCLVGAGIVTFIKAQRLDEFKARENEGK